MCVRISYKQISKFSDSNSKIRNQISCACLQNCSSSSILFMVFIVNTLSMLLLIYLLLFRFEFDAVTIIATGKRVRQTGQRMGRKM